MTSGQFFPQRAAPASVARITAEQKRAENDLAAAASDDSSPAAPPDESKKEPPR